MIKNRGNDLGQSLLEFIFSSFFLVLVVLFASSIVRGQWDQTRCAYLAFEETRNYLCTMGAMNTIGNGGMSAALVQRSHQRVKIKETETEVVGQAQCRSISEQIILNKLEGARW